MAAANKKEENTIPLQEQLCSAGLEEAWSFWESWR